MQRRAAGEFPRGAVVPDHRPDDEPADRDAQQGGRHRPRQTQTFVFAITPTAPISQEIPLQFTCGGGAAVPTIPGVNTFLLTASSTPTPDMIMIDATATKDGNLVVPGATASGAIAS